MITAADLEEFASAVIGRAWRPWVARRLDRTESLIRYYEREGKEIPKPLCDRLKEILTLHKAAIERLEKKLE